MATCFYGQMAQILQVLHITRNFQACLSLDMNLLSLTIKYSSVKEHCLHCEMDTAEKKKDLSIFFIMGLSITREMIRYQIRPWAHFSIVTRCHLVYSVCSSFWLVPGPGLPSCETDFVKELRGTYERHKPKNNRL